MTTFTNDFHGTNVIVKANNNDIVSNKVAKRVFDTLCGVDGCQCNPFNGSSHKLVPTNAESTEYRVVPQGY